MINWGYKHPFPQSERRFLGQWFPFFIILALQHTFEVQKILLLGIFPLIGVQIGGQSLLHGQVVLKRTVAVPGGQPTKPVGKPQFVVQILPATTHSVIIMAINIFLKKPLGSIIILIFLWVTIVYSVKFILMFLTLLVKLGMAVLVSFG